MTNHQDGGLDFNPNEDYLAQVKAEQGGEGVGEIVAGVVDPVFAAETIAAVASTSEVGEHTPADAEAVAEIEAELGIGQPVQVEKPKEGDGEEILTDVVGVAAPTVETVASNETTFSPEEERQLTKASEAFESLDGDYKDDYLKKGIVNFMDLQLSDELKNEAYRRLYLNGLQDGRGYGNRYAYVEKNLKDHPSLFVPLSPELASPEEEHSAALKGIENLIESDGNLNRVRRFMEEYNITSDEIHALDIKLNSKAIQRAVIQANGEDVFQNLEELFNLTQHSEVERSAVVKEAVLGIPGNFNNMPKGKEFIDGLREKYSFSEEDIKNYISKYIEEYYGDRAPMKSEVVAKLNEFGVNPESVLMRKEFRDKRWAEVY